MSDASQIAEVHLDRMRPAQAAAAMDRAPVAWLPVGALEYHAPHLPIGTDSFTAVDLLERAARAVGGVVLPPVVTTLGTLHLPWSLRFDGGVVEATLRATIDQLATAGARVVVVHTGHAPLDLLHRIKRVCREAEAARQRDDPTFRCYGLCYLELNVAQGAGLGTGWPVPVDHGSVLETSLMLAIAPDLVDLDALPATRDEPVIGIYGPDPRGRASTALGEARLAQGAQLLADRVRGLLAGGTIDGLADLRLLVDRYWPEPMELSLGDPSTLLLRNRGPVSRYLTGLEVTLDGVPLDASRVGLRNATPGEAGNAVDSASLGPEHGFYVRRAQSADVLLPRTLTPGRHAVSMRLGLAAVTFATLETTVDIPAAAS